jgi:hypothetical protein
MAQMQSTQMQATQSCSNERCSNKRCSNERCSDSDKRQFIKPKSYSELLKENQELSAKNINIFSKYIDNSQTIKSLQDLNMNLIQKIKEKDQEVKTKVQEMKAKDQEMKVIKDEVILVQDQCQIAQDQCRFAQDQCRLAQEESRLAQEQKQIFIRTYTNMSIEMLKLEEKLAKFEGRIF